MVRGIIGIDDCVVVDRCVFMLWTLKGCVMKNKVFNCVLFVLPVVLIWMVTGFTVLWLWRSYGWDWLLFGHMCMVLWFVYGSCYRKRPWVTLLDWWYRVVKRM